MDIPRQVGSNILGQVESDVRTPIEGNVGSEVCPRVMNVQTEVCPRVMDVGGGVCTHVKDIGSEVLRFHGSVDAVAAAGE